MGSPVLEAALSPDLRPFHVRWRELRILTDIRALDSLGRDPGAIYGRDDQADADPENHYATASAIRRFMTNLLALWGLPSDLRWG